MNSRNPQPPEREKSESTAASVSPLVLSRSSQKHAMPSQDIIYAARLASEQVWEELLSEDEYFIDLMLDSVHDYLDHLAAETAAFVFKETVIGELIPQLVEPAMHEEMINALVTEEVVFEITDALVETLHDIGHFSLPEHDHEKHGPEMHHYISHIREASELHIKRKLALHTHRIKRVTEAKANVKENRVSMAAEVSHWLTKKRGGMTNEQKEEARRRDLITSHSSFLAKLKTAKLSRQDSTDTGDAGTEELDVIESVECQ
jgi:hypothetical protein